MGTRLFTKSVAKFGRLGIISATALTLMGSSCGASVIYSDFGAGDTYQGGVNGYYVGFTTPQIFTASFTPSVTSNFTTLRLAVKDVTGTNAFFVALSADAGGVPGAAIESFSGVAFPGSAGIINLNSVISPVLTGGSTYWITLAPPTPNPSNATGFWFMNSTGALGLEFENSSQPNWLTANVATPAFEVDGTPVDGGTGTQAATPEPSSIWLMFGGVAIVLARATRGLLVITSYKSSR